VAQPAASLGRAFAALAEPTRRGVIALLRRKPRSAGELARALHASPPALSRHLRVLREAGLIREAPLPGDARVHVYQLRPEPFAALRSWLDDVEAFWTDQLTAFREYAERRRQRPGGGK